MPNQFKLWFAEAKRKASGWLVLILAYKLFENWVLGQLQTWLGEHMSWLLNHIGQITWAAAGVVFLYLMAITWRDSRATTAEAKSNTLSPVPIANKADQVSENIVKHIQSVAEQLRKVTAGAYSCSLKQILRDILADGVFVSWYKTKPLIVQLTNLFNWQLDQLFDRSGRYDQKVKSIAASDVPDIYNEIHILVLNYRSSVTDFVQLLNNLEKEGAPAIWNSTPISDKIYRELRDNYNELMQRVKNLMVYVAKESKSLLPTDDQLTKFDRIDGIADL